jgi:cytochrome P450
MLIYLSITIAIVLSVLLYFTILFIYYNYIFYQFKGPFALPLIGNCYTKESFSFVNYLISLRKRYGKVFVFYGFWKPRLVICEPIIIRRILSDTKIFPKGSDYRIKFAYVFGEGLVTSIGDKHKKDKAIFSKYFVKNNIMKWTNVINNIGKNAINDLLTTISSSSESSLVLGRINKSANEKSINIDEFFACLAFRTFLMFSTTTDTSVDKQREKHVCHLVSEGSCAMGNIIVYGIPLWNWLPPLQTINKVMVYVNKYFEEIIQHRYDMIKNNVNIEIDDCLSAMIEEKLTVKDMTDHFITLISAGHDTTAYFSSYLFYLLAKHEHIQDKLRNEINSILKDRDIITCDDITEMIYLTKVMQETLRFYSVIPAISRVCTEETYIKEASVTIPKGAEILIPMSLVNRDPTIWENPSEFNPDRFEGKITDFTSAKNGFFPFGYGSRGCIGNTFAQIESGIFICQMLRVFRIEQDPGFKLRLRTGISITAVDGVKVILKPL